MIIWTKVIPLWYQHVYLYGFEFYVDSKKNVEYTKALLKAHLSSQNVTRGTM